MRVLLVDSDQYRPVSPLFADCLGPDDCYFDESPYLSPTLARSLSCRVLGRPWTTMALNRDLLQVAKRHRPDLVLVVKGQFISSGTLARIKAETGAVLVNFATDDLANRRVTSRDLLAMGVVEEVVPEPEGGAHMDFDAAARVLDEALFRHAQPLLAQPADVLLQHRYERFRYIDSLIHAEPHFGPKID